MVISIVSSVHYSSVLYAVPESYHSKLKLLLAEADATWSSIQHGALCDNS